ncbi:serine/threonine protein kinase [Dyella sp. OK004]|uniref:protein kinase domain-containing protein n=1 Tax=Dyella sp. OK004 TaxID=1855292 RepID=UPI0008E7CDB2|nr:protein kinase [Dyella sp. OK004]SFS12103.1 serine/threonine protein kinase [Dyella sp. OK004]
MTDRFPRSVGRYRIDGILGKGATAVVYAGFDPDIEREVAIKCLHREVADDPGYRKRFQIEARAAGHLTHPHIVTIFEAGETDDGRPYIAMERLSGETLASRVASEGFPAPEIVIELASQIAAGLDYAHAQSIVHHDIKPENIMLAEGWHYAKIADFGIAERRRTRQAPGDAPKEIGGTPTYMAMERLRGEPSDARSDLFSLGVVLFWMITGKLPWSATGDVQELLKERLRTPLPTIEPRDPATPSMLVDVARTLLAPMPDTRYQRGAEVVDDLRAARREYERLHEKPLAARIISLRLRWAGMLGATLTLVLLLGLAAIYAKQNTAVTGLAQDFGQSMGRMIASESAENLLLGDRAATRALVEDVSRNRQIHYLAIADRTGHVIASTRPDEINGELPAPTVPQLQTSSDGGESYLAKDDSQAGESLLFDVPIRYQTKAVGELRLGINTEPLRAAQRTTLGVIVAVLLVTLVAVVGAAYWLFRQPLMLLDLLGDALLRVSRGDFAHRIRLTRRDELGRLFHTFNLMNSALQSRQHPSTRAARPAAVEDVTQPTQVMPASPPEREPG